MKLILITILLFSFSKNSFASTGDCEAMTKVINEYNKSFTETDLSIQEIYKDFDDLKTWGIEFDGEFNENGKYEIFAYENGYPKISKISPAVHYIMNFLEEYDEDEGTYFSSDRSYIRAGNLVAKINGKSTTSMTTDEIVNEMNVFKSLTFLNSDNDEMIFYNDFLKEYAENLADEIPALSLLSLLKTTDVSSTINLKNISSIDTKKNNSLSSLDITTTYYDKGLASFFEQKNKSTLTCKLKPQEASNLGIYTEFYYPHDFVPKIEPQKIVSLSYTPASFKKDFLGEEEEESEFEIVNEANYTGLFKHSLDLKKFPFDKQVIDFMFKIDNDYALLTNPKIDQYQTESFKQELVDFKLTEWDIKDSTFAYFGDIYESDEEVFVPTLIVGFYIDRKSNYYVFKILLPILIILIISWSVFWIRPQELESRITISIVCMLSLIAYNFVIDENMPKIGFLTLIDWFIILAYVYSAIPTIETVIINNLEKNKKYSIKTIDEKARYLVPTSFAGLAFLISVLYLYSS